MSRTPATARRTAVTCPRCGAVRLYFPSAARLLATGICAACRWPPKIRLVCPECGRAREVMPSVAKVRRSTMCRSCATSAAHATRRPREAAL